MESLGSRLKDIRLKAGLTLRELARQAEVSPSFVSQIENGKSQPSVATLYVFSQLLDVSVDELFEARDPHPQPARFVGQEEGWEPGGPKNPTSAWPPTAYSNRVSVVHPTHRPHLNMAEGVVWERLAATPEHAANFMKITYAPGATSTAGGDLVSHVGWEYGYVLEGELEVTIGEEVFHLHSGESLGFDSAIPHVLRNPGETEFVGLWFVHGTS
ncbi:helix-turn-helix domain-containing protein [Glaciihabitans sp. INWT7]|uniref:helix-turn-helix domain-containing protein n=1 Tax=Glaciihabitans sp. INWT7 TaxID=2596912 RepID=UPI002105ADCF|nr:helix-turn-helix domain-containing protein [Glaciihabitans sp. INWT7]